MPSDFSQAVWRGAWDIWNNDADKLGNAVAEAKVRDFLRDDDPRLRGTPNIATIPAPFIVCSVKSARADGFGSAEPSKQGNDGLLILDVYTRKDRGSAAIEGGAGPAATDEDSIAAAIAAKFHEQVIQSAAVTALGWLLGRPCLLRESRGPVPGTDLNRRRFELTVDGNVP